MSYETGTTEVPPVIDWINDWDWLDPQWGAHAIEIWNSVREICPVATTERYGRAHMPVTMEAIQQVAHHTEHFSSRKVSVALPDAPRRPVPPITSDPPDHRRLLLPSFGPKKTKLMEDDLRQFCRALIADLDDADRADAAAQYSQNTRSTGSAGCSARRRTTPTCSATSSSGTSSSRRETTQSVSSSPRR